MSEDLQALSAALTSEDPEERESAAQQLAELKEDSAAPYLQHALDDEAEGVRMWGAYGLALLMRPQDRPALARAAEEDDSQLVRLWATFGLAAQKDGAAAKALADFLDSESVELRSNAADAITSLDDAAIIRPHLEQRMRSKNPRTQAWAAGVLHAIEHPTALSQWRQALVTPASRVDAALVAPFLQSQSAARDLLRLLGELSVAELDAPVEGDEELPLGELLSRPLPDLGLDSLLDDAQQDAALRGELLLLLLKGAACDPDVLTTLHNFAADLPPGQLGGDVAALLADQHAKEHPNLLARVATAVPDAVEHALLALQPQARKAVFDTVAAVMRKGDERAYDLMPLLDVLRTTRFAEQFEDVPDLDGLPEPEADMTAPQVPAVGEDGELDLDALGDEDFGDLEGEGLDEQLEGGLEDDLTPLIERMVAGEKLAADEQKKAQAFLDDLGMSAEEYIDQLNAEPFDREAPPPTAMEVAQRALALGALLRRSEIESKLASGQIQRAEATRGVQALKKWLDEKMLLETLTPLEADLLDARTGDWADEDRELVEAGAEALAMLLWALGKVKAPTVEEAAPIAALLKALPILQDPGGFVDRASIKDHEEISRTGELWETWAFRVQQEDQARIALEDPDAELGIDMEALIAELKKEGFDDRSASAKGKGNRAAEALRFLGRKAASKLVEDKQPVKLVSGDLAFKGKPVSQLDADVLDQLRGAVNERSRAIAWITSGGNWDDVDDGFDDFGAEEG